ncbi:MAG: hypothetical protein ACRCU1_03400 [Alsobacter sp.]
MTAISIDTNRDRFGEPLYVGNHPIAATTEIPAGAAIGVDPAVGYAVSITAAPGLRVLGVATKYVDNNPGVAAAKSVAYECGVFPFENSASGDAIAATDVLSVCFFVDNNTVAKTSNSGARCRAGIVVGIQNSQVLVLCGLTVPMAPTIQVGRGTLVAGVLTVNAGITITAESVILAMRMTEGGTDGDELRIPTADRTVGGPGTGAITIRAFLNGSAATSDTSTVEFTIVG